MTSFRHVLKVLYNYVYTISKNVYKTVVQAGKMVTVLIMMTNQMEN